MSIQQSRLPLSSTSGSADTASSSSSSSTSSLGSQRSPLEIASRDLEGDQAEDAAGEGLRLWERLKHTMTDHQVVINTFIAGGLAGATSRTVVSPFERLKIILQVQAASSGSTPGHSYTGVWPSLARMWKEEGFAGFMKGNGINVIRILPYSALQFTSYGGFKTLLRQWSGTDDLSTPLRLAAGAGAGIVAVTATYPLDLVRARLSIATARLASRGATSASNPLSNSAMASAFTTEDAKLGIMGMTKKVYATEGGLRGLYRGCWATAVGIAPYVSLNFYIYESLKQYILPDEYVHDPTTSDTSLALRKLLCGAGSGATSLIFTHPFDVLRRKLQVAGLSSLSPQYSGAIDAMRKSIIEEGFWKAMYRGLTPNLIKVTPSIAVSFYTFETVRDWLAYWEDCEDDDHVV